MKRIAASLGWLILLVPFISVAGVKTIYASAALPKTENRTVSGFHGVYSGGSYDVFITIGGKESLRLEGDEEVIEKIETVVEDGILKIRNKNKFNFGWSNEKIRIYITAKSLDNLTMSGSGTMQVQSPLKSENFQAKISGSGSIKAQVTCSNLSGHISGSGEIYLSGSSKASSFSISGSGDINAKSLSTENTSVKISGSGSVTVDAREAIDASISGSGDVYYVSGNPHVNMHKSGSGKVRKI
jgi:hypothetical protein